MTRPAASHYTHSEIECIDAIRAALGTSAFIDYCRGNAMKYLWRCGWKDSIPDDLKKARDYLTFALEELGKPT